MCVLGVMLGGTPPHLVRSARVGHPRRHEVAGPPSGSAPPAGMAREPYIRPQRHLRAPPRLHPVSPQARHSPAHLAEPHPEPPSLSSPLRGVVPSYPGPSLLGIPRAPLPSPPLRRPRLPPPTPAHSMPPPPHLHTSHLLPGPASSHVGPLPQLLERSRQVAGIPVSHALQPPQSHTDLAKQVQRMCLRVVAVPTNTILALRSLWTFVLSQLDFIASGVGVPPEHIEDLAIQTRAYCPGHRTLRPRHPSTGGGRRLWRQ